MVSVRFKKKRVFSSFDEGETEEEEDLVALMKIIIGLEVNLGFFFCLN